MYKGRQVTVTEHSTNVAVLKFANEPYGYIDETTEKELVEALDLLNAASRLSVVVITGGQTGVFMQQYDTLLLEARARQMKARGLRFDAGNPVPEGGIHRALRQIEQGSNTYIAAINGSAIGCGYELALACDLRLAQSGDFRIGIPDVHLGLMPGAGGTQRLTRLVGEAKAIELLMLGDTLSPADARAYGLVNDVVDDPVLPVALHLAGVMAEKPARARAHIKQLVRNSHEPDKAQLDYERQLARERTLFCDLMVNKETLARLEQVNAGAVPLHDEPLSDAA